MHKSQSIVYNILRKEKIELALFDFAWNLCQKSGKESYQT